MTFCPLTKPSGTSTLCTSSLVSYREETVLIPPSHSTLCPGILMPLRRSCEWQTPSASSAEKTCSSAARNSRVNTSSTPVVSAPGSSASRTAPLAGIYYRPRRVHSLLPVSPCFSLFLQKVADSAVKSLPNGAFLHPLSLSLSLHCLLLLFLCFVWIIVW